MSNMTMAQFSFDETDAPTANQLHLINSQITLNYIDDRIPKIVVLTDLDWSILQNTPNCKKIDASLKTNYRLIYSKNDFGQHGNHIDVYLRREDK